MFVVENRDLLVNALELLRKSNAVTPDQEAQLVATFEESSQRVRTKLLGVVENLQLANFGQVLVQLHTDRDSLKADGKSALDLSKKEAKALLEESKKEGKALLEVGKQEGRVILKEARGELQSFLDQNQPTVEAVTRVSEQLAAAGRELAASLKYAGREAADELIKRGKVALSGVDTEAYEQAFFDWSARTVPRVTTMTTRFLLGIGATFILVGLLIGSSYVKPLQPIIVGATVILLLIMGIYVMGKTLSLQNQVQLQIDELNRIAAMPSRERRHYFQMKWKSRPRPTVARAEPAPSPPPVSEPAASQSHETTGLSERLRGGA